MSVKLVNVSKVFRDQDDKGKEFTAVSNVNLEIHEGEMVTFLGPSGCGKTTTLRILSGFETPTTGEVYIDGELVNDIPANKRNTSMVFQSYAIFPHLSVAKNIGFGLELKGLKPKEIKVEVLKIMEVMGLTPLYDRRPDQLSGGQQQRVALARAIINKPGVLLFDEPLSNLDAKLRVQMRIEIRRIQQQFGITSIYVTHDQDEAMTVSDRIMVMDKGVIQQIGTPFEIYSRPKNLFVADFIGRANFIPGKVDKVSDQEIAILIKGRIHLFPSWNKELKAGDAVAVVVRPEGLHITGKGNGKSGLGSGKVLRVVYLGATVEYEIEVDGFETSVLAVTYNPVQEGFYKTGDLVDIDYEPISAHVVAAAR